MRVSWDDLPISTTTTTTASSSFSSNGGTSGNNNPDSTLVTVPCLHDVEHATIGLDVLFQSDYLYWLRQELQARRDQSQGPPTHATPDVSSNRSALPTSSLCSILDVGCSCNPLWDCTNSMTNQATAGCRVITPQQQRQQQKAEQEEEEDATSPWEWICSVC